jgi:sterol 3beta-glucosyltransferase
MDQFYWCRRVAALGLAPPPVRRSGLQARALAEAIAAVVDNEVVRERAAGLAERLRRADPLRPENQAALLERVLRVPPRTP